MSKLPRGALRQNPGAHQCGVAVSADGVRWFLINASPIYARKSRALRRFNLNRKHCAQSY
jgi:hypothetical protein